MEQAILEYIERNQHKNLDMADICIYFKLSADIIGTYLSNLETQNKIKRENYFGCSYRYIIQK